MKSYLSISLHLYKTMKKLEHLALTILPILFNIGLIKDVSFVMTGGVRVGFLFGQKKK